MYCVRKIDGTQVSDIFASRQAAKPYRDELGKGHVVSRCDTHPNGPSFPDPRGFPGRHPVSAKQLRKRERRERRVRV